MKKYSNNTLKLILTLTLFSTSCSHFGPTRKLASSDEVAHEQKLRLFNTISYLPRSTVVFQNGNTIDAFVSVELSRELGSNELVECEFDGKKYNITSKTIFESHNHGQKIECKYSGDEYGYDIVVNYEVRPPVNDEFEVNRQPRSLNFIINQIVKKDNELRLVEPAKLCTSEIASQSYGMKTKLQHPIGETGEFCSQPLPLKNGFVSTCVGKTTDSANVGRVVHFNTLYNLDKTLKFNALSEDLYGVDHQTVSLKINDSEFAFPTYDGRVVFIDHNLNILKTINLGEKTRANSQLHKASDGTIYYAAVVDDSEMLVQVFKIENRALVPIAKLDSKYVQQTIHLMTAKDKIFLTTDAGYILALDREGNLLDAKQLSILDLNFPVQREDDLLITSYESKLWKYNIDSFEVKMLYQAPHSGQTDVNLSTGKVEPVKNVIYNPVVMMNNGDLVLSNVNDGRIITLTSEGKFKFQFYAPTVNALFSVEKTNLFGEEVLCTTSVSYITYFKPDGSVYARYSNSGAENYFCPTAFKDTFLAGMYNGIHEFKLDRSRKLPDTNKLDMRCKDAR